MLRDTSFVVPSCAVSANAVPAFRLPRRPRQAPEPDTFVVVPATICPLPFSSRSVTVCPAGPKPKTEPEAPARRTAFSPHSGWMENGVAAAVREFEPAGLAIAASPAGVPAADHSAYECQVICTCRLHRVCG